MIETKTCPKCGAALPTNAPQGICPKCLMRAGVEMAAELHQPASGGVIAATTPQAGRFVPPEPNSLAPHFPQLEIRELLGQGGMGAVYKARQTKLDRLVALKIIRPESADDPSFAERFNREARTLARLNHPNIVGVHDFGEVTLPKTDGDDSAARTLYYFLMEYVDGANLRQLLQGGELKSEQALAIVPQICEALQFAHDEGIVHRDIKPENILVDARGRVRIADFGLAKLVSDDVTDYTLTGTHQVLGTPRYMAPEQMEGARAVDHRADIYSLGVVFYEMLTGELPLGRFDPPSRKATIDPEWDEVVLRALEKEPDRRYQHASEVKSEVERVSDLDRPPVRLAAPSRANQAVAVPGHGTKAHYGMLMMGAAMAILGVTLLMHPELERTHLFLMMGTVIALGGGGCAAVAFSVRLPRRARVNTGRLMQGGILVFMGAALLLFCYLRQGGWFVGNLGIWIGIALIHGGGAFFIGAWSWSVEDAESGDNSISENADRPLPKADELDSNDTASFRTLAELLHGPSIGLMVAGAINCLSMLPWTAMAYRGMSHRGRIFGTSEEYVMVWLFVSAVVGIPIVFAALKMRQAEAYRLSMMGAIIAMLPLTPGAVIGIPTGLWALAVLTRRDVLRAFASSQEETDLQKPKFARSPNASVAHLLNVPSIGLMVAGAVNCLCFLPWVGIPLYAMTTGRRVLGSNPEATMTWLFVSVVAGIPILFAALKMRQVEAYRTSMAGALISILPVTPGALIGMPMGLWALALLTRKDVRRAFGESEEIEVDVLPPPKFDMAADSTRRFSRKAIVGACWAPFFLLAVLPSVLLTHVETSQRGEVTRETVSPHERLVGSSGSLTEDDVEMLSTGTAWWQWILIVTVLPLGLTAPFGTTVFGLMSISNIRHSHGRLIGMPLALADALLYPMLLLDCLILASVVCLILLVVFFTGFGGLNVLAVGLPAVLVAIPTCAVLDFLLARAAWRRATSGVK